MHFSFDLISDLHVETWQDFDWTNRATSPFCVVAGDVAKDHESLRCTLQHLSRCYQAVFYIDGNEEHKNNWNDLDNNYASITKVTDRLSGVIYLQNNLSIINGVAIVCTNGWWSWDFQPEIDIEQSQAWFRDHYHAPNHTVRDITCKAISDLRYFSETIKRLQLYPDVKKIVLITHTVPRIELINHCINLIDSYRINTMGNRYISQCLEHDLENKVSHWCFGHFHGSVDRMIDGVRYVNNCRGRGDTNCRQLIYHPLKIEVKF